MTSSRGVCARRDCESTTAAAANNRGRRSRNRRIGRKRTQRAQRKRPDKAQRDLCVLLRLCKKNARPSNPKKDFSRVMDGSFQGYGTLLNLKLLRAWHGALLNTTTIAEATAPSPCEARAGRGLGRGAPSIELARLSGTPLPYPLPTPPSWGEGIDQRHGGVECAPCRTRLLATNTSSDRRNRYPGPTGYSPYLEALPDLWRRSRCPYLPLDKSCGHFARGLALYFS